MSLVKGTKFALTPLYLGTLYFRLDKFAHTITRLNDHFDMVIHASLIMFPSNDPMGEVIITDPEASRICCHGRLRY